VLVVRTRQPFFKSKPGRYLSTATLVIICVTILIPFTKLSEIFGFGTLPPSFLLVVGTIVAGYVISAEIAKKIFYRKVQF
jgi:Mg2+-importing ATPase